MTKWKAFEKSCKYGVALYNFQRDGQEHLKINVGDSVQITEENDDWFRGYINRNRTNQGIFPKSFIHLKDASISRSGSYAALVSRESPIAQEITSVLREWHAIWRSLYVEKQQDFETVRDMMQELIDWRRKIMSRKLTAEELRDLQQKISTRIDIGNAMLGLDLVVRDDQGNILDPFTTSTIELYRQHVQAADRIRTAQVNPSADDTSNINWPHTFNLYVMLRNFVCRIGEDADILMSLYDVKVGKFISENYLVKWSKEGVPKDIDMLNNFRVVFTDLGAKDRQREKVYLVFQIIRIGVMDPKDIDDKKQTRGLKRPFGVAAMDITEIIQGTKECNEDSQVFIPFQQIGEKEHMEGLIKKVVVAKEIYHKGQGLWVSMKILSGDLKQAREDHPHLVAPNIAVARKMGFPDVILPGDVRNDIYVTLKQGEFNKGPAKTSDKNVECRMVVCNKKGEHLSNVISHGGGGDMLSEYKSLIYYHEDKPKWFETVKVAISTEEEFKGLHLKFFFKHKSTSETKDKNDKSFAMSFVKLMNKNGTTLSDTDHNLLVYKIEDKKGDKSAPYLDLPSTREDLEEQDIGKGNKVVLFSGPYTLSQKDSFTINTFVCSTKLTHNVDLLGLLRWQEILNDSTQLQQHLDKLMHVDGEEIVKFLQDLLDSLFSILMQNTISDMHDNQVFEALVYIIGLISDRKYQQFRPVLDAYVKTSFSFALAYQKLMVILKDYVDRAVEVNQKILKGSMKSLEYLFKFIVQSRTHFAMLNEGRGKQQFQQTLKQLIQAISGMMLYTSDNMLLAQGSALKYISTIISDVLTVFDAVELSELMKEFINNVPKDRLTKQKLKCIDELVHSELFTNPECRQILLPMILEQTKTLMDEKKEEVDKRDELEDCINVLSDIMDVTFLKENGPHEEDISLIMKCSFRTVIQSAIQMDKTSKVAGNCVSVLMGILRQMTESHYRKYIEEFPYSIDLRDFLMEILMLFQVLVSNPVYPSDWMDMIMLQNSIILRALRFFAQTVHDKFSEPFEEQLWSCFFHCSISFLTQRALQLESFTQLKRNKVINRYKDMRRETGFEIRQMWFQLGIHKIYFIPALVGPILEMTLIPETELRKATIPIFFDMMQCEFTQVDPVSRKIRANFQQVENELIIQLDALVEGGCGDEEYKQLMYDILYQLCCGHSTIREQGIAFVEIIKTLLQRLLEYRNIIQNEIKEHRMSCIVNLLNYYHDIRRQEMYIRYLYKLCELHLECDNYTEAANTLLLHVNLLQWSDDNLPLMLQSSWYPESHTHRELKEQLYYNIIQYYDKGKMWEKGIQLCKELVSLYEIELFDYERLSFVLKRQADLYSCIIKELRPDPEYFRVGYYGRGFPEFLQNIVFIYRGKEYERLSDFNARMQTLFPNAELLRTLSPPSEEIKESDKQYLQINAVTPVLELQDRFKDKPVSDKILKYYTVNEVQKFTYSRRMNESESDIAKMWLERTYLTTSYPLPGILCWFPVINTELVRVSPLECAIETLESTNKKINSAIEQHSLEQTISVQNLGMLLNGVVDASVNGGISNYKIFYADDYGESEEDMQLVIKLKELTRNQLLLLKEAMTIHKRKCAENMRPFHAHMEERFEEMCNLIKSEYNLKVPENSYMNTLKRFKSMSAVSLSRVSEAFVSITGASPDRHTVYYKRMNYATPVTRTSTTNRTPSVFVRAEKTQSSNNLLSPSKGLQQKVSSNLQNIFNINLNKRASFATSEHSSDGSGGSNRNSLEHPIELSEQITPKRPPRPESSDQKRQSRPISSTQFRSDSNLNNSNSSLLSNHSGFLDNNSDSEIGEERAPPPLPEKPEKHHYADYSNLPDSTPPPTHTRIGHRKSKPVPPLPNENDTSEPSNPPPVPKKTHHSSSPFSKTNNHK